MSALVKIIFIKQINSEIPFCCTNGMPWTEFLEPIEANLPVMAPLPSAFMEKGRVLSSGAMFSISVTLVLECYK